MARRVGIVGYGSLGRHLVSQIENDRRFELAFVWNRTVSKMEGRVDPEHILLDLDHFASRQPDLVVEVAHPSITKAHGAEFLKHCDFLIGSPSALCDEALFTDLKRSALIHGLYVPSGAFWGAEDVRKLSEAGKLKSLHVTMKKHPLSLKLRGNLKEKNARVTDDAVVLYDGPIRELCDLAPNNVNTMAVAAVAAPDLGFDGIRGTLVADPKLVHSHVVEIEACGFPKDDGSGFRVRTVRENPAVLGEVTGEATYAAYFGSLARAKSKGSGVHLC
ncbi:aspartate dehydrogenase domain-containing protein-like [Uloborus diversus]|uniref:aspartate dehydrogenase domain-containing protein-like n=1 Tax=Uloborus diversus TaxID=327109 RepID=UPI00240A1F3E|nr:aspartate dehydrogenase domain-containing protein-like [Uloborus diversus]